MKEQSKEIKQLIELLRNTTDTKKHSAYQILSESVKNLVGENTGIKFYPKYEKERFEYIISKIDIKNKKILDIGCNTGYFVFEFLKNGAENIIGYEGGEYHSKFVELATKLLKQEHKIHIIGEYYDFKVHEDNYDITLLLNVLHHLGDDYGDKSISMDDAKSYMISQLNSMSNKTDLLVFQMGFNWKGDVNQCLFENGTKAEMIEYIKSGIKDYWDIIDIGIAEGSKQNAVYCDINNNNIERKDSLGEFLNRPLFLLKSKKR
jgi:Protein of unknown function (DUF1698)